MKKPAALILAIMISASIFCAADEPMIVAHRGASKEAPQNTLPAFNLAWKQGADAIEGDFHLTKDGKVVCIHDRDTKKVAKKNLLVRTSTLAELRTLDVGVKYGKTFEGTTIPTIAEVFATIPDNKIIYVEIKCGAEIIPPLLEEIRKSGLKNEQIVVICFNAKVLGQLKEKAPELKASWLCKVKKDKKSGAMKPSLESVLKTIEQNKLQAISSGGGIPQSYIDALKEKGYGWHVWTVNDAAKAKRMKAMGVASITTDVPKRLRKDLDQQHPVADSTDVSNPQPSKGVGDAR